MKKQEFLSRLGELNLDVERFCVISGGVMLLYGLKDETQDIDIKMSPEYFEEIRSRFPVRKSSKYDYLYELADDVEVAVQDYQLEDIVVLDGVQVESLEKQLEWKLQHGRDKDLPEIERIKAFLQLRR